MKSSCMLMNQIIIRYNVSILPPLLQVERLEVGQNRDRVYVYLHPGAIVNGKEVNSPVSPSLSLPLPFHPHLLSFIISNPFFLLSLVHVPPSLCISFPHTLPLSLTSSLPPSLLLPAPPLSAPSILSLPLYCSFFLPLSHLFSSPSV